MCYTLCPIAPLLFVAYVQSLDVLERSRKPQSGTRSELILGGERYSAAASTALAIPGRPDRPPGNLT
jgi:hypothetical protein